MICDKLYSFFSWKVTKRHVFLFLVFTIPLFSLFFYFKIEAEVESQYNNYFIEESEHLNIGYLLNTPKCKILNISAYDVQIRSFLKTGLKLPICPSKKWTYKHNSYLILNNTAIVESGYSPSSLYCCFNTITRAEQSPKSYTRDADRMFNVNKTCIQINEVTEMVDEFIQVTCISKHWPYFLNVVYKDYHAFAIPQQSSKTDNKIEHWKNHSIEKPPNIFMFGIDSISRLNSIRTFPKIRNFLNSIGAYEMIGYTKVGDNTFPNSVAFHTGYSEEELEEICYKRYEKQDFCPYIWKKFDVSNYFTSLAEDVPFLNGFNYMKTGFVEKPVDFYLRPIMLKAHNSKTTGFFLNCIGDQLNEEFLMSYIENIMNVSSIHNVPFFIYSWFTKLAHEDQNEAQSFADLIESFLRRIDLSNTILFFMSDHGRRYGQFRNTNPGWFEDKLPMQWVYIPPSISRKHKDWKENLIMNSKRLTSPYDIFQTLAHVLETELKLRVEDSMRMNGTILQRKHGVSLFKEVPLERTCQDAGIPSSYCACSAPTKLSLTDLNLQAAAESAIKKINSILPLQCSNLTLSQIHSGALLKTTYNGQEISTYIVGFETKPGIFVFEASVELVNQNNEQIEFKTATLPNRNNKINTDTSCTKDNRAELYCFCLS